jgi:hypothetical protein
VVGEPWSPRRRRWFEALAAAYALLGGSIAGALLLAGLSFGALAVGLVVTFTLALVTARGSKAPGAIGIMTAYSLAFTIFSWPVLLLLALGLAGHWQ